MFSVPAPVVPLRYYRTKSTGNWIKIVQRLPVRIALEADELPNIHSKLAYQ